jgi:PAS domain S-box-containing protein
MTKRGRAIRERIERTIVEPQPDWCAKAGVIEAKARELETLNRRSLDSRTRALRRFCTGMGASLGATKEKLVETLESMSEAFFMLDRAYRFVYLNRAALEFFGRSTAELAGKPIWKISPRSVGADAEAQFRRAMRERRSAVFETFSPLLGIWLEIRLFPVGTGLSVYMRDVDRRKSYEESLKRQARLLDVTYDAVIVRDLDDRILFWNRGAEEKYGWKSAEVVGRVSHDLFRTVFPKPLPEIRAELFGMSRWEGELIHTKRDGSRITVATRWTLERDESGRPTAIMEISNDITKRKRAEQDLVRLATAIESVAEGVAVISGDAIVEYVNPAWSRMTGYEQGDVIGRGIDSLDARAEEAPVSIWRFVWQFLTSGRSWSGRTTSRRSDGTPIEMEVTASPVRDGSGRLVDYVIVARDVTERAELERQLRQSQKMEAIGTLAGGIAHDFNNILAAILGFSEMALEDQPKGSRSERFLRNVVKASMRGRDIASQILTYSRRREEERRPVLMAQVLKESLGMLRGSIPSTIRIVEDIADTTSTVFANAGQVQQVVTNLCANAAYAMRDAGGIIRVGLARDSFGEQDKLPHPELRPGRYLRLSIADTGPGIPPEAVEFIFDPFFTTKKPGEGTGLGLSVTQGIVKSHGGVIAVASQPGKITVFDIYWPIVDMEAEDQQADDAGPVPGGDERILVVDDEEPLVEVAEEILTGLGYSVVGVADSIEALELFMHDPYAFDLVVTDQVMPHLAGLDMARRMIGIRPDIPLVLLTGFSETPAPETTGSQGIRETVMKPVARRDLAKAIRRALDR